MGDTGIDDPKVHETETPANPEGVNASESEVNNSDGGGTSSDVHIDELMDPLLEDDFVEAKKTHLVRLQSLLTNPVNSDIVFRVGINLKEILAHKVLLVLGSAVFRDMFMDSIPSLFDFDVCQVLEVPDVEPEIFKILLTFLYTGDCVIDPTEAIPLRHAAKKFVVDTLASICDKILASTVTVHNVLIIFQQAGVYKLEDLRKSALDFICENGHKIVEQSEFKNLSKDDMSVIIAKDEFGTFDLWGKSKCVDPENSQELKSVLGSLVHLIRFPQMKAADLGSIYSAANILTDPEVIKLLMHFLIQIPAQMADLTTGIFNPHSRKYFVPKNKIHFVQRLRIRQELNANEQSNGENSSSLSSLSYHAISFKVQNPIWLTTIGVAPPSNAKNAIVSTRIKLKIIGTEFENVLGKKVKILTWDKMNEESVRHVYLDKPLQVKPGILYTINLRFEGQFDPLAYEIIPDEKDTPQYIYCVLVDGGKMEIEFHNAESDGENTTVERGQIPELGFQLD